MPRAPGPPRMVGVLPAAITQAVSTLLLAGIGWTIQLVVYPAFGRVPAAAWPGYHAAHTRGITAVVGPPWVAQGLSAAALLVLSPGDVLVLTTAALALAGVVLTLPAVVAHRRPDALVRPDGLRRLLRINLARTVVWSAGAVAAGFLVARAVPPA